VVGGSEKISEGVSSSGVKPLWGGSALGGRAGNDLSILGTALDAGGLLDFLRRRAINDSWQDMQNIPWEVRA
jgi:hypothetical protein